MYKPPLRFAQGLACEVLGEAYVQWALPDRGAHWTLYGSVQRAPLSGSAHWTPPWSVQRALATQSAHWTLWLPSSNGRFTTVASSGASRSVC
ncbi:hypothetical protein PCANC_01295 [Puccinia coronata f. sp. avenae]|uniref:Uncharacterized protein n=1 Tax=Puccinia coronata f. sp. avenae TaxID=200324 RepID=A0A2N5W3R0_9BASI|nr:hypothetical protein PCANC_01295 [Puccinia coronata f. sp. avenae]